MNEDNVTYFDSFEVEHIPKGIKKSISNKNIKANICRIQANNSTMCEYFCIGFTDFLLKDKFIKRYIYFLLTNMKRMIK